MKLKERIDLILECLEKTGGPIIQSTEYKGYSVGLMLAGIKTNLNREKAAYPEEQLARLREKGLLEPKIEKLTDKAERVAEYVTKNPRLWHSDVAFKKYIDTIEDEEKRAEEIKAYQDAKEAYTYLRRRKTEGKLDEETSEILRQAGVGGPVFGYSEETKLFAEKIGFSNRNAQIILIEFGGFNGFREEFIALMLDRDIEEHTKLVKCIEEINRFARNQHRQLPFIQGFDMSQPNFLPSRDDINFLSAVDKTNSSIYGYFITEERIWDYINSLDNENNKIVVKKYFGLEGNEPRSLETVGKEMDVSREAISDKVIRFRRNLEKQRVTYQEDITEEARRKFIERFFESNDIFIDEAELSPEVKDDLSQIYIDGLQAKQEESAIDGRKILSRLKRGEEIPIDEVEFSARILNLLQRNGYDTLNKLLDGFRTKEVYEIQGLGRKTLEEIQLKLEEFGIIFTRKKGSFTLEEMCIPDVFEKIFGQSMSELDMRLKEMINALVLAGRLLREEQEMCSQLNGKFEEVKREELELIEKALASEGIEL